MSIVQSGGRFVIYGEDVKTYNKLPADTYMVMFDQMSGYYLVHHNDLTVDEKVYGPYVEKVSKVMNTFNALGRNMGIILSGPKGVGKSVFARLLAEEGKRRDLPLIIITHNYPGLSEFISSLHQECIVLFDEFEKVFGGRFDNPRVSDESEGNGAQDKLLSLFDGIDDGKKLYVITCNNVRDLSTYLLNRPGRFHYHFMLNTPSEAEIREYLEDNLNDDATEHIDEIVALSSVSSFTYDVLRAVVFELNQGYSLDETLQDLNIERDRNLYLDIQITFTNGITVSSESPECIEFGNKNDVIGRWYSLPMKAVPPEIYKYCRSVHVKFPISDLVIDANGCRVETDRADVHFDSDDLDCYGADDATRAVVKEFADSFTVASIKVERSSLYTRQRDSVKFSSDFFW